MPNYRDDNPLIPAMPVPSLLINNSAWCVGHRSAGMLQWVSKTLTASGTPVAVNLFAFEGLIKIEGLWLIFDDVTNVADIDDAGFDAWDGTNSINLTDHNPGGLTLDGVTLHSIAYKETTLGTKLSLLKTDQVRYDEPANSRRFFQEGYLNGKTGVTNYIRFRYDNTDTNLNCQIRFYIDWVCLSHCSKVETV